MKPFSKSALFGFMFLLLAPLVSFSQVIQNDAVLINTPGGFFGDFELGLAQTTSFGGNDVQGLFGFGIEDLGNDQFQFGAFGIAEEYALYLASPGDVVGPALVNNTVPFASNFTSGPSPPLTLAVGESVFFGYFDESDPLNFDSGFSLAEGGVNFGWLELGRSARLDSSLGQLEILGGATAIGRGIIVGTITTVAIPEPGTFSFFAVAGTFAMVRRQKR